MDFEKIRKMKKAEIHIHLDGSVRVETAFDLAKKDNIKLPVDNKKDLVKYMEVSKKDKSLVDYLKKFELPVAVMQSKENLARIAYELLEDLAKRNYIYVEVRFAPILHTKKGLDMNEVIEAVLDGMEKAKKQYGIEYGLLLSVMRHMDISYGFEVLELAKLYKDRGIVGIDLAGDEKNFSVKNFEKLFKKADQGKINYTIHAGEASGSKSVEAALDLGAKRIGHGIRAYEDENVLNRIIKDEVILEVCPISNYQTNVVSDFTKYPILDFIKKGVKVSLNTDNQTVSNTTLIKEIKFLNENFDLNYDQIKFMIKNTIMGSFTNEEKKKELLKKL